MSRDDNHCDRCGRTCRDNPPTDFVALDCEFYRDRACVQCCDKCFCKHGKCPTGQFPEKETADGK